MVQRRVEPTGQLDHRAGALDIGGALVGLGGGDVVDRGAVHDVIDGAQLGDDLVGEPEVGRGEVADQRFRPRRPMSPGQALEPRQRLAADQDPHLGVVVAGQNLRHDTAADKPGTAGNDIAHASHGDPLSDKGQPRCDDAIVRSTATIWEPTNADRPERRRREDRTQRCSNGPTATPCSTRSASAPALDDLAFTTENSHDIAAAGAADLRRHRLPRRSPRPPRSAPSTSRMLLHGSQGIRLFTAAAAGGQAAASSPRSPTSRTRVRARTRSSCSRRTGTDPDTGEVVAETFTTAVIRGEGGFGGQPGQRPVGAGDPRPRTRRDGRAAHPRGPGADLPAVRRPQPAAQRSVVRTRDWPASRSRSCTGCAPTASRAVRWSPNSAAATRRRSAPSAPGSPRRCSRARR